jgi:hypothetical protein
VRTTGSDGAFIVISSDLLGCGTWNGTGIIEQGTWNMESITEGIKLVLTLLATVPNEAL